MTARPRRPARSRHGAAPPRGKAPTAVPLPGAKEGLRPPGSWLRPRVLALLVALGTLVLDLVTLAPTVTSEDSGELVTAAARWGVAHPPGYPLYCLLVKPFLLLPIGNVAYRANVASACFGALTAGGIVLLSLELSRLRSAQGVEGAGRARPHGGLDLGIAALAGIFVAGARDFWAQSVIAEVYTLHTLLLVTILLLLLRGARLGDDRHLLGAAALFGASLAHHYPLMLLAAPSMAVYLLRGGRPLLRDRRRVLLAGALLLLGLSVYAYLPLAARGAPPLNWGDPSSLERFFAHVARSAYRKKEVEGPISLSDKLSFAGLFVRLFAEQWTAPVLAALLPLGVWRMRDRAAARDLLLGVMAVTALGLVLIPGYTYEHENIQRFDELYLPVYIAAALFLAEGCAALAGLAERMSPEWGAASWVLCAAAAVVPIGLHHEHNDLSRHRMAETYNRFILESLPPGAVYVTSGDSTSFPSLYLQAVEGVRPDVILANFTGDLSPTAMEYVKSIDRMAPAGDHSAAQRLMVERGSRPVYVASKSDLRISARTEPFGFVYRVQPLSALSNGGTGPDILSAPILGRHPRVPGADDLARGLAADYLLMLGEAHARRGDRPQAVALFQEAATIHGASKETVNNIGSTCAERGFHAEAEEMMRRAASMSPTYVTPRRNLARLLDSLGRRREAIAAFEALVQVSPDDEAAARRLAELRSLPPEPAAVPAAMPAGSRATDPRVEAFLEAIRADPGNPALHNNLGSVHAEAGDAQAAIAAYEEALRIDPGYALAHKNLAALYRDLLRDPVKAEGHMAEYRRLAGSDAPPGPARNDPSPRRR